jgi:hypothetical protein
MEVVVNGKGYYVASLDQARKRIRDRGLFARGNGTWTLDEERFEFARALLSEPIRIRRDQIGSVQLSRSSWWGGKWLLGARVVEVTWTRDDGSVITSGFVFSGKPDENQVVASALSPADPPREER